MSNSEESLRFSNAQNSPERISQTSASPEESRGTRGCGPLILDFRKLAQNRNEFFIRLDGETYRLQLTRNNKLILTK